MIHFFEIHYGEMLKVAICTVTYYHYPPHL